MDLTKTASRLRGKVIRFSAELSKRLGKATTRFVTEAVYEMLAGQSLSAVSSLLGHSYSSVTMKYYTDKVALLGSVVGSLNITSSLEKISTTLSPEGGGKNEIPTDFHHDSNK